MSLTDQAPWAARRIGGEEMRAVLIDNMAGKQCWRWGKYLGSMLFFDFGKRIVIPSVRRGVIEAGEATLGVRDCYWELCESDSVITDSVSVDDETMQKLEDIMIEAELVDLAVDKGRDSVNLLFSNSIVLKLDTSNRNKTADYIAEFTLPSGKIYSITPKGNFILLGRVSTPRAAR
jgi:hypothetical protein